MIRGNFVILLKKLEYKFIKKKFIVYFKDSMVLLNEVYCYIFKRIVFDFIFKKKIVFVDYKFFRIFGFI